MATTGGADDHDQAVEFELPRFVRLYKSGRFERLSGTDVVPASLDPATGVTSRDVTVDPTTNVWARLYLPSLPTTPTKPSKLPVVVYFHGGGFIIESAASPTYHNHLNSLAARASILVVSVDYRRAPEHPLPIAYDDSFAALRWVFDAAATDPWLASHADLSRVFLAGDSAGATIAHEMALRASSEEEKVKIKGMAMVHPFFWGAEPLGSEVRGEEVRAVVAAMWRMANPGGTGVDDPWINPTKENMEKVARTCERVVVAVAEKDILRERGRKYSEELKASNGKVVVELLESEGEEHVFHLFKPECEKAREMVDRLVDFFNRE